MENTETYLKWCLKQQRGIRLVEPSENLVNAYLEKSKNALRSMEVNARESIIEWAVSAGYTRNILPYMPCSLESESDARYMIAP